MIVCAVMTVTLLHIQKFVVVIGFLSVFLLQNSFFALAHGNAFVYEETKDGYVIDIDRGLEFPIALEPIRFDFSTYPEDLSSVEGEIFTDVWVRISQDRTLFFSGGINKPVFGATGFTYVFPKEGSYELTARFQNESDTVVETTFTLEVLPATSEETAVNPLLVAVAAVAFGVVFGYFIPRKKS